MQNKEVLLEQVSGGWDAERLRQWCRAGKIKARKIGNSWIISVYPDNTPIFSEVKEVSDGKH